MSPSKHAVELCALLVDEIYGELTSRIFTILLRRGRLPIPLLSKHTRIPPRQLRHGLAVLIQQSLVYHNTDNNGTTHYEANPDAAYNLVRSGKILDIVETKYGIVAVDVVRNLFLLGHLKVSDLINEFEAHQRHAVNGNGNGHTINGVNGQSNYASKYSAQINAILIKLLQAGLLEPVFENMFRSPADTYNAIEKQVLQNTSVGGTKGTKQKEELRNKIQDHLQALRSEREWKPPRGLKRQFSAERANGVNGTSKRRRLSNGAVNGEHVFEDDDAKLDLNMVLRINYEKFIVALRNQRLVELANDRIGLTTSKIYEEALNLVEDRIPRCQFDSNIDDVKDLPDGPTFTTMELTTALGKSVKAGVGIGKASGAKIDTRELEKTHRSRNQNDEVEVDGLASSDEDEAMEDIDRNIPEVDVDSDNHPDEPFEDEIKPSKRAKVTFQDKLPRGETSEDCENRMLQIKNHLLLLAGDDCRFLRKCGTRGLGEWTIDFDTMTKYLQESETDQMILENFGKAGHRLVRMMKKLGKLDEKQLPNLALLKSKDVRTKLAEMQMAGVVEIQEVPRDSNRTASRTIYLWYFEPERASMIVLDGIYKTMSRCFQRLDIERRRAHDVLSLTERSDLRDHDVELYLQQDQLNQLQDIQGKEEYILGQIGRLDGLVGIFRDY